MKEPADFSGKRVLLGSHLMSGFTGSEMHVAELVNHFRALGADVSCLALEAEGPMAEEMKISGQPIINPWQLANQPKRFDLVWSHQETVFLWLHVVLAVKARRHLHGLLSWQHGIEGIPLVPASLSRDNLTFLANSEETRDAIAQQSGRGDIAVMPNFVPQAYASNLRGTLPEQLARVAVVSNHVPNELLAAKDLLEQRGVSVTIFGKGHTYTRLNETTLTGFDTVITIGKTVQYCLTQGIPVFVYDRFGGPGFMRPADVPHHGAMNFSGRSDTSMRGAKELVEELLEEYPRAHAEVEELRTLHAPRFALETCVSDAVGSLGGPVLPALTASERLATLRRHLLKRPQPLVRMAAPKIAAALSGTYDRFRAKGTGS